MSEKIPFRYKFRKALSLKNLTRFLTTTLIGGFIIILPIGIFIFLMKVIFDLIAKIIKPLALVFTTEENAPFIIYLLAFAIVIAFCFFLGLFVRTRFGNAIIKYFDNNYLSKLPFYNTIQQTVQQLLGEKDNSFSQVVLVDVFNTKMTGFVTEEHDNDLYTVFVPTAPNPTNGFIFHVEKEKLIFTDVKPEDAMRTVIGVGTGSKVLFQKTPTN